MKVYRSRHKDVDLPKLDILSLLFDSDWCLAREDSRIHVEAANPENYITKAEARILTQQIAYILRHDFRIGVSGLGKDYVLTVFSGGPFAPVFFYGLVAAGGVYCGASTEYQPAELVRQIRDADVSLLVCSPECHANVLDAAQQCGIPEDRVLILESSVPRSWRILSSASRSDLLQRSGGRKLTWRAITTPQELEDISICLLYSSGTTGLPKGVRVSHRSLVANNVCTMDPARRYMSSPEGQAKGFKFDTVAHLPMANIAGISLYATNPFYMGGTTYWMDKYDFDKFIEHHRTYRPAYQFSVPPIWLRIAKSDKVTDHFDGLQVAVTGSAPIGSGILPEIRKKLGRGSAHLAQTWGTTETAGVIAALDWPSYAQDGTWNVGELCPNVTLRVLDEDDEDVEEGESGELVIGGPILGQGYHKRADATSEAFVDGFYRSGDIGFIKEGLIQIHDRKKELIKYKGSQVAPAELEALLISHARIADAAVIGVWDEDQQTEVPRGYVVRQQTQNGRSAPPITGKEVADFVKSKVASYKQLRGGVFFVEEIPKSASGKILRKELRIKAQEAVKAKL